MAHREFNYSLIRASRSETGRRPALELGERRHHHGIAAVFTSDLHRAVETAKIAFAGSDIPVFQDRRLRECNYGALNGMPVSCSLLSGQGMSMNLSQEVRATARWLIKMRDFLRVLATDWDARRVLLISHSANRWALDCLLGRASLEDLVDAPFA